MLPSVSIKRPETGADNDLFALAELIEKNEFTDAYTRKGILDDPEHYFQF